MSMCSLTDFIEVSLGRCGGWLAPQPSPARGPLGGWFSEGWGLLVAKSGDFSWPPAGTSDGHNRGLSRGHGQPLSAWAEISADAVAVAAMVDRLVQHAEIIVLQSDSYRLKDRAKEVIGSEPH